MYKLRKLNRKVVLEMTSEEILKKVLLEHPEFKEFVFTETFQGVDVFQFEYIADDISIDVVDVLYDVEEAFDRTVLPTFEKYGVKKVSHFTYLNVLVVNLAEEVNIPKFLKIKKWETDELCINVKDYL